MVSFNLIISIYALCLIRSLIAIVGEKAKDQVVLIHHMLSKAAVKARPSGNTKLILSF